MEDDGILDPIPPLKQSNPKGGFLNGVAITLLYYASGLGLAGLTYAIVGHPYIHAPGFHHWLMFLTFAGGFIWKLAALGMYFSPARTRKLTGIILSNAVATLSVVLWFYSVMYRESPRIAEEHEEITMSRTGDTTTLYYNDNTIYMKVQDSVLLNFIDTVEFQRIVDSAGIRDRPRPQMFQH